MKSKTEWKDVKPDAFDQSIKIRRINHLSYSKCLSFPSNDLEFLSHYMQQKTQSGIELHSSLIIDLPLSTFQQSSRSITPRDITHCIPKKLNIKYHNSLAIGQCKRRWEDPTFKCKNLVVIRITVHLYRIIKKKFRQWFFGCLLIVNIVNLQVSKHARP